MIHQLRLLYHFTNIVENEINPDQSLLKQKLTWTPLFNKHKEFGNQIRITSNILFYNAYKQDNIKSLHKYLNELILLTTIIEIIKEKADKRGIVTIMSSEVYWNACQKHPSITEYYEKVMWNPKTILQEKSL